MYCVIQNIIMRNLLLIILSLLAFASCSQDDYSRDMEENDEDIVLPAKSDSTGIIIGGSDIGFDDDDPPASSINNPTVD